MRAICSGSACTLVAVCIGLSGCATRGPYDRWHARDWIVLGASAICHTVDSAQTVKALHDQSNPSYYEMNPLLGDHPSKDVIWGSAVVFTLFTYAVGLIVPERHIGDRATLMTMTVVPCAVAVFNNRSKGLGP